MPKIPDFENICGRPPRWIAAAPGRVNVISEHTDFLPAIIHYATISRSVARNWML